MSSDPHFGLTGLATMGANLARNVAHHDIPVAVHNRTTARMETFIEEHGSEGPLTGHGSVEDWVGSLARPRVLMSMVQAGDATDAVIEEIAPLPRRRRCVDRRRQRELPRHAAPTHSVAERGVHFLGVGVSGGEEGALNGPSIMPGGDRAPYDESVRPILEAIAARVDGTPCCTYVGPDGAGHYVKMVHNGIEYADMQLIAESYDLLRHGAGLEVPEIAQRFERWNESELESFLIEIAARVLAKTDDDNRAATRRRDPRRSRAKGHRPLDRPGRARARRPADRDHRGGVRTFAERPQTGARGRRRPARRTKLNGQNGCAPGG